MSYATSVEQDIEYLNRQRREFARIETPDAVAVFRERGAARNDERAAHAYLNDAKRSHYRLEETPAGRYIAERQLTPDEKAKLIGHAQLNMASAARGNVETFVAGAPPDSLFRNGTMQMLFDNPGVTHINGIEKDVLVGKLPEDTFKNVWASELIRDHQRGKISSIERPGTLYHGAAADPRLNQPAPSSADPHRTPKEVCVRVTTIREKVRQREIEKRKQERAERERQRGRGESWER